MKKQLSAIFLLSGTAIGSGMISLPIIMSHIGIILTAFMILFFAGITYLSALVRVELNLQSDSSFTLEDVGLKFSGELAAVVGNICLKIMSLSLLSAYIYGLSSLVSNNDTAITILIGSLVLILFVFSSEKIMYFNGKLFVALLAIVSVSIACMIVNIDTRSSLIVSHGIQFSKLCVILPTLFTSFGFQASIHSLTKFCNNDKELIKNSCFYGSLIPAVVYLLWTICVISVISNHNPGLFLKMTTHGIDIDELITALGNASNVVFIKYATFAISILAIITSVFGVGIAFVDDIEMSFKRLSINISSKFVRLISALIAVIPAIFIATFVPEAFIKVLGFAGMILAVIAILLPSFLFFKINRPVHIDVLRGKAMVCILMACGFVLVACEIVNLLKQ